MEYADTKKSMQRLTSFVWSVSVISVLGQRSFPNSSGLAARLRPASNHPERRRSIFALAGRACLARRTREVLGIVRILSALFCLGCFGATAAPLAWFPGPNLNEARSGAATVVTPGGGILMFGGSPLGATSVLVFGGANAQAMPVTRVAPGAAASTNGLFFVYGGTPTNNARGASGATYSYNPVSPGPDPENPNINQVSPMLTARSDMAYAADAGGHAYAIGGLGRSTNALATVERYDPVADSWTTMASLPGGRYHFGAVFDSTNTIYTFGGRTNAMAGSETATVLAYSVSDNVWNSLSPMPVATAGSTAFKGPDGKYYVIGGTSGGLATNLVQVYDRGSDTWSLSTPLPVAVSAAGGGVDTLGRLVVMGGADNNNLDLNTTWVSQSFNQPDAAPVLTSSPRNSGNCLSTYTYTATASGSPQPVYRLLSGPDGMQIDYYAGTLSWTPQVGQFGSNFAIIQASNYAGAVAQSFSVNVRGPLLAPPANLAQTAASDTTVTFSWSPVVDPVGPVTYQLYLVTYIHDPKGSGGGYYYGLVTGNLITNSVTITGLTPGSGRSYAVTVSAGGVVSGYSATLGVSSTSPQPPQNLRLTELTTTTTSLAWDPSPGAVPIVSYSVIDAGGAAAVTNAAGLTNTHLNLTGLTPGSYHLYEVFAFDAEGYASSVFGVGATTLTVWNPLPTPAALTNVNFLGVGGIQFTVNAGWVRTTLVQATTNLADPASWLTIATNPPASSVNWADTNAARFPARFYRVVSP